MFTLLHFSFYVTQFRFSCNVTHIKLNIGYSLVMYSSLDFIHHITDIVREASSYEDMLSRKFENNIDTFKQLLQNGNNYLLLANIGRINVNNLQNLVCV